MANLSARVQKLEATSPKQNGNFCLVVHHENCADDRKKAIAEFVAKHAHEPKDFIEMLVISPETKRSICGCG